jgi:ubiquinone/menaquinone biosynthesis C-methylase UbiE
MEGTMDDKADAVSAHEYKTWQESAASYIENVAPMTARSGQISILQEIGNIQKSSAILELGCGTGDLAEQLAEIGGRTVGIDFSENMIQIASERFPLIAFKVADAESVPFHDNEFDVVVCNYTAHHFARPQKVFEEARRTLKPGGRVVVVMPIQSQQESFGAIVQSVVEELSPAEVPGGPLLFVDDPDEVASVLTAAGFTEVMAEK